MDSSRLAGSGQLLAHGVVVYPEVEQNSLTGRGVASARVEGVPDSLAAELLREDGGEPRPLVHIVPAVSRLGEVVIATADFQHAYHCMEAVRAGRDVYIEKPLANRMEDNRAVLKTVTSSDRIVQIGTQRRSGINYINAAEFIKSGKFGKIVAVEITWNVNQPKRWRHPDVVASLRKEDTDWRRFLVDRPYEPWNPRIYVEYRLFWPYSTGIPGQWMVHQIDTVHWFTGYKRPNSVVANGGIYLWKDGRRNADTLTAVFEYGEGDDKFQVIFSSRQTQSYGGVKEVFLSNYGMLNLDTNKISGEGGLTAQHSLDGKDHRLAEMDIPSSGAVETGVGRTDDLTVNHMANFMDCIRSGAEPMTGIEDGINVVKGLEACR